MDAPITLRCEGCGAFFPDMEGDGVCPGCESTDTFMPPPPDLGEEPTDRPAMLSELEERLAPYTPGLGEKVKQLEERLAALEKKAKER
jgi:hypothetical protein